MFVDDGVVLHELQLRRVLRVLAVGVEEACAGLGEKADYDRLSFRHGAERGGRAGEERISEVRAGAYG